jgi:hypothetical protein
MEIKELVQYRAETKKKTKITLSVEGIKVKLAYKDVEYENEILDYARRLRSKLLTRLKLNEPVNIKVNYIDGSVHRYKYVGIKYNGETLRWAMEVK